MKSKLVIVFVLLVNTVFAATGYASDFNFIVGFIILLLLVIIGIGYLSKYISRRREAKKNKSEAEPEKDTLDKIE